MQATTIDATDDHIADLPTELRQTKTVYTETNLRMVCKLPGNDAPPYDIQLQTTATSSRQRGKALV